MAKYKTAGSQEQITCLILCYTIWSMVNLLRFPKRLSSFVRLILEWLLLFAVLVAVFIMATRSRAAPQIILVVLLHLIAINFSLPIAAGIVSPVWPVIVMSSLLLDSLWPAVLLMVTGFVLAEVTRPVWKPLWKNSPLEKISFSQRFWQLLIQFGGVLAANTAFTFGGGSLPLTFDQTNVSIPAGVVTDLVFACTAYALSYLLLTLFSWWIRGLNKKSLFTEHGLILLASAIIGQPFALFGAFIFSILGLPVFVIFCVGSGAFALLSWLSWQRNFVLNQQLSQFSSLNVIGVSLRETLDLPMVLQQIYQQINQLIPADDFFILLKESEKEGEKWQKPLWVHEGQMLAPGRSYTPDDFTQWVINHQRLLDLDPQNIHFAARHQLTPPIPKPAAWLGVPLTIAKQLIGVMVLQRFDKDQPFSRWSRELLLSIAGQASAAIQNARLYSEVVRLYNLADEALAQRLKQLEALLNSSHEGVLMLDTSGRVALINPLAANLLNHPQQALTNQPLEPTLVNSLGYSPAKFDDLLQKLTTGQQPASQRSLFEVRLPAGRRFMERNELPVLSDENLVIGWLMVFRDVTEEQEQAEWRTNVTNMIVHDLRNPVTTLLSHLELITLESSANGSGRITELLQTTQRSGLEMLDMIDSLMDMTRLEAGKLSVDGDAMRLPPLLTQVVGYMRPLADKKQIKMSYDFPPDLPAVWGDEEMLRRVLVNLLDNGLKFTPAGGQLHIALQAEPAIPNHEAGIRCLVKDSGPGVPIEYKEKIFDRFVRVNSGGGQVRGTGLGLTFCKLAIAAHGGQIWAEDTPAGGSQFIFILPGIPLF